MKGKEIAMIGGGALLAYMFIPQVREQVDGVIPDMSGAGGVTNLFEGIGGGFTEPFAGGGFDTGFLSGLLSGGGLSGGGIDLPDWGSFVPDWSTIIPDWSQFVPDWSNVLPAGGVGGGDGGGNGIAEIILKKTLQNTPDIVYQALSLGAVGLGGYAAIKTAPAIAGTVKAGGNLLNAATKQLPGVGKTLTRPIGSPAVKAPVTKAAAKFVPGTITKATESGASVLAKQTARSTTKTAVRTAQKTVLHPEVESKIAGLFAKGTTTTAAKAVGTTAVKTTAKTAALKAGARVLGPIGAAYTVADVGVTIAEAITGRNIAGNWLGMINPSGPKVATVNKTAVSSAFGTYGYKTDDIKKLLKAGMSPGQVSTYVRNNPK
jgi:hypothetical protein